jgi:uncharacterized membrane protein YgcG
MAETTIVSETFRCPVCLFEMSKAEDYAPETVLECARCHKAFVFKEALPVSASNPPTSGSAEAANPPEPALPDHIRTRLWIGTSVLAGLLAVMTVVFGDQLRGEQFLIAYIILGLVTCISQYIIRHAWKDLMLVSGLAVMVFLIVGVTRLLHGYFFLGMRRWLFLLVVSVFGVLLHLLRFQGGWGNGGSGCSSAGSSCGSSCGGGGGCGGGGCGGCGGS